MDKNFNLTVTKVYMHRSTLGSPCCQYYAVGRKVHHAVGVKRKHHAVGVERKHHAVGVESSHKSLRRPVRYAPKIFIR
jgi:hypothetical protein